MKPASNELRPLSACPARASTFSSPLYTACESGRTQWKASYSARSPAEETYPKEVPMKVILWTLAVIFIIGLLVVLGVGGLIF